MSFFQSNVKFHQSLGFENCIEYLEPIFHNKTMHYIIAPASYTTSCDWFI